MYVASCVGQPVKLGTGAATAAGAASMRGTMQYALSVEGTPWRQLELGAATLAFASPRMQMTCTPMTVRAPASHLYSAAEGTTEKPAVQTQFLPFKAALASLQ